MPSDTKGLYIAIQSLVQFDFEIGLYTDTACYSYADSVVYYRCTVLYTLYYSLATMVCTTLPLCYNVAI